MNVWESTFAVPYGRPRRMPHYFPPVENKIPMRELKISVSSVILQFPVLNRFYPVKVNRMPRVLTQGGGRSADG